MDHITKLHKYAFALGVLVILIIVAGTTWDSKTFRDTGSIFFESMTAIVFDS